MNNEYKLAHNTAGSELCINFSTDEICEGARDVVLDSIEQNGKLDPAYRTFAWSHESIHCYSMKRICARHSVLPVELIRSHLLGWLEQGEVPRDLPDEKTEEWDSLMEPWIDVL